MLVPRLSEVLCVLIRSSFWMVLRVLLTRAPPCLPKVQLMLMLRFCIGMTLMLSLR